MSGAVFSKFYKQNCIDLKSKEVPTVLDRNFPKVYTTIDRKALEIHKNHVKEDDALFPSDFTIEYSNDYLFIKSFYDSIILGNTNEEQIKNDIQIVLLPKDETMPWQKSLEIVRSFRNYDHKEVEAAFSKTIEFIQQNKYDLNELVVFVNFAVDFIQKKLISYFPDVESLCEFIKPNLKASLPNTLFNFNDHRRLSFQHNEKIDCITTLEKELIECKELLIKQFYRGEIDGLMSKTSEDLEFLTPENIVFIMEQGSTEDLDKITDSMTSSIKNINTTYQIFIEPNFFIRAGEPQIQNTLFSVLDLIKQKSKKDKVMEYIANEIITKFPDHK
ncbi:MAG: hypothetical protein IPH57_09885 [Saprospiraceae bacterium]|nr:hypothetical protein [Saprospiraceae bacterium]